MYIYVICTILILFIFSFFSPFSAYQKRSDSAPLTIFTSSTKARSQLHTKIHRGRSKKSKYEFSSIQIESFNKLKSFSKP